MKTSILAATLFLGLGAAGTAQTAQAAPINLAPAAAVVTLADAQADRGDLLHTVKGFKRGHRGFRKFGHRRFGGHGFGRRGFINRGFGHRSFGHGGFGNRGFGGGGFGHGGFGHHGFSGGGFGKSALGLGVLKGGGSSSLKKKKFLAPLIFGR